MSYWTTGTLSAELLAVALISDHSAAFTRSSHCAAFSSTTVHSTPAHACHSAWELPTIAEHALSACTHSHFR